MCNGFLLLARLHSVGVQTSKGGWRLLSSPVTLHVRPAGGFSRAGQTMTPCHLRSNYSSMATLHGGPLWLRLVRVTPFFGNVFVTLDRFTNRLLNFHSVLVIIISSRTQLKSPVLGKYCEINLMSKDVFMI